MCLHRLVDDGGAGPAAFTVIYYTYTPHTLKYSTYTARAWIAHAAHVENLLLTHGLMQYAHMHMPLTGSTQKTQPHP